jgi:preprotein translocase subunit YajC
MALVLPFLLLFGLLFFMNRGEKKKRTAFESKLKRGDKVITRAGIKGKLLELNDNSVKVEIAPGVSVFMVKGAVEALDPGDAPAAAPFKDTKVPPKEGKDSGESKDSKDKKK